MTSSISPRCTPGSATSEGLSYSASHTGSESQHRCGGNITQHSKHQHRPVVHLPEADYNKFKALSDSDAENISKIFTSLVRANLQKPKYVEKLLAASSPHLQNIATVFRMLGRNITPERIELLITSETHAVNVAKALSRLSREDLAPGLRILNDAELLSQELIDKITESSEDDVNKIADGFKRLAEAKLLTPERIIACIEKHTNAQIDFSEEKPTRLETDSGFEEVPVQLGNDSPLWKDLEEPDRSRGLCSSGENQCVII